MLRTSILLRNILFPNIYSCVKCSSQQLISNDTQKKVSKINQFRNSSPFQEIENAADLEIPTITQPAFNFSAYINKSKTLQELLKLGVDLHQLEKRKGIPEYILKLDFERDIKEHLLFLHDMNVPADALGKFITTNPLIFKEEINNLLLRVCYLQSKNFSASQITRVILENPFWLMFNTKRIDRRLGFFQNNFDLKGDDIRFLTSKQPNLITYNLTHVRTNTFAIKEEMGFDVDEMRCLILSKPRLWMMSKRFLL
jgi:mTERF domain-containing protein, mitochondrial